MTAPTHREAGRTEARRGTLNIEAIREVSMTRHDQNVDTVDQLSSLTLLGLALIGAAVTVTAYWLLGS